jgi:hypothetical protein
VLKRIRPSVIIGSSIAVLATAYIGTMAGIFISAAHSVQQDRASPQAQTSSVTPDPQPVAVSAPAPSPVEVVAPVVASPAPAPTVSAPIAPAGYTGKYAAEMSTAGIAESDQPIVASLMLSGNQWAPNASPQMREISRQADPTLRIIAANAYVQERWGSWQGASDFAAAHGGNW